MQMTAERSSAHHNRILPALHHCSLHTCRDCKNVLRHSQCAGWLSGSCFSISDNTKSTLRCTQSLAAYKDSCIGNLTSALTISWTREAARSARGSARCQDQNTSSAMAEMLRLRSSTYYTYETLAYRIPRCFCLYFFHVLISSLKPDCQLLYYSSNPQYL